MAARTGKRASVPWIVLFIAAWAVAIAVSIWLVSSWHAEPSAGDQAGVGISTSATSPMAEDVELGPNDMVVSVSSEPLLRDGLLRVNFVVLDIEGATAERLEIKQSRRLVYASTVVQPGGRIEWAEAPEAREGTATATVYAVNGSGADYGNPVDIELQVRGS